MSENNRLLNQIIDKLSIKTYIENKTGWNNFEDIDKNKIDECADEIISIIKQQIEDYNNYEDYSDTSDSPTRFEVTYSKKKLNQQEVYLPYRVEEALERVLVALNPARKNQIALPDGGHIDFITDIENGSATLVELKMWTNGKDSPLYALIEVLKNYFLFQEVMKTDCYPKIKECFNKHNIKEIKQLIVLAPKEYYAIYTKKIGSKNFKSSYTNLFELIKKFQKKYNITIKFKYIDLPYEEWNNNMKKENIYQQKINMLQEIQNKKSDFITKLSTWIELDKLI